MRVRVSQLLAVVILSFTFFGQSNAQSTTQPTYQSSVSGYVMGAQKSPIGYLQIELMNEYNRVIGRTRTDGSGRYYFRGLNSGRYTLRVLTMSTEYEEQSQEIEIAGYSPSGHQIPDNILLDFHLKPRKTSATLSAAPGTVFVETAPDEAKKLYEKGLEDLRNKRTADGVQKLEAALKIYPTYFAAAERLGLEHLYKENYGPARASFLVATAANARSFDSWYGLAYADFALDQNEESRAAADKAIELVPNSVPVLRLRGLALRRLKQYSDAEKSLVQAKKFDEGKTPDLYWNLALLYAHNLKRYKDAATELDAYLRAYPTAPNKEDVKKLIRKFET